MQRPTQLESRTKFWPSR